MKNKWIVLIFLIGLTGFSVFLFANCGQISSSPNPPSTGVKGWQIIGNAGISATGEVEIRFGTTVGATLISLFVYHGTPYVAYPDLADLRKATVMRFSGSSWESVGAPGFSPDRVDYLSLAIYNGTPYVAFQDYQVYGSGKAERLLYVTVMKYNGSDWEYVGEPAFSADGAANIQLFIDNGTPYVAYLDRANSNKATVMKFNGTSWEAVGSPGFSSDAVDNISLFVYSGTSYIAYNSYAYGKVTVMKFNGLDWEGVGQPVDNVIFTPPSLSVYNGTPYLAYTDQTSSASIIKFNVSTWESIGSPSFAQTDRPTLQVYNGIPYIAFQETGLTLSKDRVSAMKFNGSDWEYVGKQGFSSNAASDTFNNISFFIDLGVPFVAYADKDNGNKITVMKYIE